MRSEKNDKFYKAHINWRTKGLKKLITETILIKEGHKIHTPTSNKFDFSKPIETLKNEKYIIFFQETYYFKGYFNEFYERLRG